MIPQQGEAMPLPSPMFNRLGNSPSDIKPSHAIDMERFFYAFNTYFSIAFATPHSSKFAVV